MARCLERFIKVRQRVFLTPTEAADQINTERRRLAAARAQLESAIVTLTKLRCKPVRKQFEVKLVIDTASMETPVGEQAAIYIATAVTRSIIEQHRRLKVKGGRS